MHSEEKIYRELLPVEARADRLRTYFDFQLKKGTPLTQILLDKEKESMGDIRRLTAHLESQTAKGKGVSKKDEEIYLLLFVAIQEVKVWLDILMQIWEGIKTLPPLSNEAKKALSTIRGELDGALTRLGPTRKAIQKQRESIYPQLPHIVREAILLMQRETNKRIKKLVLEYEKIDRARYEQGQAIIDQFFENLKRSGEKIIEFVVPRMKGWDAEVLASGRGLLIEGVPGAPCSLLFSLKGQCYFIFQNVGHYLGSGIAKLVIKSISIPQGRVKALIQPGLLEKKDETPEDLALQKQQRFRNVWMETEILESLKGVRGIVDLEERMAFEIEGEKKLYLVEDYYWDGTIIDYLKYPIYNQLEEAKLPEARRSKIFEDLLEGLIAIHKAGLVHHDIKPDNVLLDLKRKEKEAVIADFQQATYARSEEEIRYRGMLAQWAPPEYAKVQLSPGLSEEEKYEKQRKVITDRLDVWGLGIIFYCLAVYELPFWLQKHLGQEKDLTEDEFLTVVAGLKKGWLPESVRKSRYFPLLEKMLEPDYRERCSAAEALQILKEC